MPLTGQCGGIGDRHAGIPRHSTTKHRTRRSSRLAWRHRASSWCPRRHDHPTGWSAEWVEICSVIRSTRRSQSCGGKSCPIPSISSNRAPGTSSAVRRPPDGSTRVSLSPWITRVGVRTLRSASARDPDAIHRVRLACCAGGVEATLDLPAPEGCGRLVVDERRAPTDAHPCHVPGDRRFGTVVGGVEHLDHLWRSRRRSPVRRSWPAPR